MSNFTRSYFLNPPNFELESIIEEIRDKLKAELDPPPQEMTKEEMEKLLREMSRKVDKIFLENRKLRAQLRSKL